MQRNIIKPKDKVQNRYPDYFGCSREEGGVSTVFHFSFHQLFLFTMQLLTEKSVYVTLSHFLNRVVSLAGTISELQYSKLNRDNLVEVYLNTSLQKIGLKSMTDNTTNCRKTN